MNKASLLIFFIVILLFLHCDISAQEWRALPIRSQIEFEHNLPGGEGEQHPHSIARSLNNPDYIYVSQDVGGCWRSRDAGDTWQKTLDKGLFLNFGQSIQVDPYFPDIVFLTVSHSYFQQGSPNEGLYRSTDGGDNWEHVLHTNVNYNSSLHRRHRQNIAYDITRADPVSPADRWYVAFPLNGLFISGDAGESWSGPVSSLAGHDIVYFVQPHLSDGKTVYVGSSEGLYKSDSLGYDLHPFSDLPAGEVSSIAINPQNEQQIFATIRNGSLYKSEDGGVHFSEIMWGNHSKIILNPGFPEKLYLLGMNKESYHSDNGGDSWIPFGPVTTFPGLGRETGWRRWIDGDLSGLVPNSQDADEFVAYSRSTLFKSSDGAVTIGESATGFTGNAWSWWTDAAEFDRFDPDRIAFFNNDVGMRITLTGGDYFEENTNPNAWSWYQQGRIGWLGTYSGDFQPIEGSQVIVASIGNYFVTQLMRSDNNGSSWQLVTEGQENSDYNLFIAFHPDDPDYVYAGDKISTDAGISFTRINFPSEYESPTIVGMCNAYPDVIYAMDKPRMHLLRSADRGATWQVYARPGWAFRNFDSITIFAADPADSSKVYTYDANSDLAAYDGNTWTSFNILDQAGGHKGINLVRSVTVDPNFPEIIYAGTFEAGLPCIFRSVDSGETWEDITHNLPQGGITAMKVNPHTGELYRGSCNGTWIFPAPESFYPATSVRSSTLVAKDFELSQNYPNPFYGTTVIHYQILSAHQVELNVYNSQGQKVKTLVNGKQDKGEYQVKFDAEGLPSGIYFYQLYTDGIVQSRKMLLLTKQ
ncbi:MAG: T9SS type A sorting domain-containing protein [Bacteroidota bacterium]